MKVKMFYKKLEPNTITYRSCKRFSNEAFIADIQNRIGQLIFLKQLLVKLFNDSDVFGKKSKVTLTTLLKLTLLHKCSSRFLNCTNGTKSRNAPQMVSFYQTLLFLKKCILKVYPVYPGVLYQETCRMRTKFLCFDLIFFFCYYYNAMNLQVAHIIQF